MESINLDERREFSLPPTDGKDAWLFLAASFCIEALIWGLPFAFGVFETYYKTQFEGNIAVIGTTATGMMYLGAPVVIALAVHPRKLMIAGLVIVGVSLVAGSFATSVSHLVVTQGLLYAIGGNLLYYPALLILDQWFSRRKGLAFGIMWAGTGLAGVVQPYMLQWSLNTYGFRKTLRIWAVVTVAVIAPMLWFVKPRINTRRRFEFSFLKTRVFWFLQIGNIIEALGYFMPGIYLPSYAKAMGIRLEALPIVLQNSSSVLGCLMMGLLIDRYNVTVCILISTIGATVSTLLLWGLSTSLPTLCIFAIAYGIFAGSFTSAYTGMIAEIRESTNADGGVVLALLSAGRGIGAVAAGPLSEALLKTGRWTGKFGYGSTYGSLIVFTGITALLGGVSWVGKVSRAW